MKNKFFNLIIILNFLILSLNKLKAQQEISMQNVGLNIMPAFSRYYYDRKKTYNDIQGMGLFVEGMYYVNKIYFGLGMNYINKNEIWISSDKSNLFYQNRIYNEINVKLVIKLLQIKNSNFSNAFAYTFTSYSNKKSLYQYNTVHNSYISLELNYKYKLSEKFICGFGTTYQQSLKKIYYDNTNNHFPLQTYTTYNIIGRMDYFINFEYFFGDINKLKFFHK